MTRFREYTDTNGRRRKVVRVGIDRWKLEDGSTVNIFHIYRRRLVRVAGPNLQEKWELWDPWEAATDIKDYNF